MPKQSAGLEIGFALSNVVREFRGALSHSPVVVQAQAPVALSVRRIEPAMLAGPIAKELEHISDVPATVRLKKADLNDWYLANTRGVQKPKRARKPRPARATIKAETPVREELKLGPLGQPIVSVDPLVSWSTPPTNPTGKPSRRVVFRYPSRKTMGSARPSAIVEDLRKIGTVAIAAGLIGIFLGEYRVLTTLALSVGVVI